MFLMLKNSYSIYVFLKILTFFLKEIVKIFYTFLNNFIQKSESYIRVLNKKYGSKEVMKNFRGLKI